MDNVRLIEMRCRGVMLMAPQGVDMIVARGWGELGKAVIINMGDILSPWDQTARDVCAKGYCLQP